MMSEGIKKVEQLMFKIDAIHRETLKIVELKSSIRETGLISLDDPFGAGWLSDRPKDKKLIESEYLRAVKSDKLNDLKLHYFRVEQDLVQIRKQAMVDSREAGARPEEGARHGAVPSAVRRVRAGTARPRSRARPSLQAQASDHALRVPGQRRTEVSAFLRAA